MSRRKGFSMSYDALNYPDAWHFIGEFASTGLSYDHDTGVFAYPFNESRFSAYFTKGLTVETVHSEGYTTREDVPSHYIMSAAFDYSPFNGYTTYFPYPVDGLLLAVGVGVVFLDRRDKLVLFAPLEMPADPDYHRMFYIAPLINLDSGV